jgi:hypothetical protein
MTGDDVEANRAQEGRRQPGWRSFCRRACSGRTPETQTPDSAPRPNLRRHCPGAGRFAAWPGRRARSRRLGAWSRSQPECYGRCSRTLGAGR